jgi:DNA-directed RNA polymerase specialized sigma24 family protein
MEAGALTPEAFGRLLLSLDADRERAGEKYEDLRRTLIRFFEWRGAPFPEEHADEALNRVARRLAEGVEVRSVGAYCYEVARLIFLETTKGADGRKEPLDSLKSDPAAADAAEASAEKERGLACLEECLRALPAESAELILEYYRHEGRVQIERRKALAEGLGLRRDALANRAQRLRNKLEHCVSLCLRKR